MVSRARYARHGRRQRPPQWGVSGKTVALVIAIMFAVPALILWIGIVFASVVMVLRSAW